MEYFSITFMIGLIESALLCVCCNPHFKYFETLSTINVQSRMQRSAYGTVGHFKELHFSAFHRDFDLVLQPGSSVLAADFRAVRIRGDGSYIPFSFDRSLVMTGHLAEKPDTLVIAHKEADLWTIQISDASETYGVEPAWRLLKPSENPHNDTMVVYKLSDLTNEGILGRKFCGGNKYPDLRSVWNWTESKFLDQIIQSNKQDDGAGERGKRSVEKNTCRVKLVADYDFFKGMCNKIYASCAGLLINIVSKADSIFMSTNFGYGINDIGLQIAEIVVHEEYSSINDHYNHPNYWTADTKLKAFSEVDHSGFCLAHLFTHYSMPNRILGLAWVGDYNTAGICGKYFKYMKIGYNTGITSSGGDPPGQVPFLRMNLVYVHGLYAILLNCL